MRLENYSLNNHIQLFTLPGFPLAPEFQKLFTMNLTSLAIRPQPGLKPIKRNRNREIFYFKTGDSTYYIKHFFAADTSEKIKHTLVNRAINSLRIANQLSHAGFQVAQPVLALVSPKTFESIYISKELPGIPFEEFMNLDIPRHRKKQAAIRLVSIFARFYRDGYIHCDPRPSNFIIRETVASHEIGLIDLEAIYRLPRPINIFTYKGIAKLYSFIIESLAPADARYLRQPGQFQYYLKKFLEIYNPKLNPDTVRIWIDKLASKRL